MTDAPAVDDPLSSLPIPPLSPYIFSDDFTLPDDYLSFDYEDLDITFDDEQHPLNTEDFFNSTFDQSNPFDLVSSDPEFNNFVSDHETVVTESGNLSGNHGSNDHGCLKIPSQDDCDRGLIEETMNQVRILDDLSSELRYENPVSSQGSGNCDFAGLEPNLICDNNPSPDSGNSVVDQKVEQKTWSNSVLKRKNENSNVNSDSRTIKLTKRSNEMSTTIENSDEANENDEKKKARLIRNRESAQLSRIRKKQYVEELEDKVKSMQATILDLNSRITFIAAENATLKQQMVAGSGGATGIMYPPPVIYPPYPAMSPMGYPWTPYPPYAVKSHGSQVPLVPIPRLETQQPASSQKSKHNVKKPEGKSKTKTKKVASISFLGLLLLIVLFGGLVPFMNVRFGGVTVLDRTYPVKLNDYKIHNQQHHGTVLRNDEHVNGTNRNNGSEPLVASLYVPRNDKLVKIDGSLIIYSVLASEKAMAIKEEQQTPKTEYSNSAVALDLAPAIPILTVKRISGRQPHMYKSLSDHQRALPSNKENLQPNFADGKMQQWFREGLSGLMLSSGMCTEVFQFDASVSSGAAIVPATSLVNITATENRHNSTYITTVKNRRILHGLPIPLADSTTNTTKEQMSDHGSKHQDHQKHNPVPSMVVSVLVDPREAGDGGDMDGGMMGGGGGGKSFSRIFVVVLLDSVKYVTYSCMLPLKGTSHL